MTHKNGHLFILSSTGSFFSLKCRFYGLRAGGYIKFAALHELCAAPARQSR